MYFKKIPLVLLLVCICACSSQSEKQLQSFSGADEFNAARTEAQDASFAMMSISTCLTNFCKNNAPAPDDEERLAKMMNKLQNPDASRAVMGMQYRERLLTLHSLFVGQLENYKACSKLYRQKLLAEGGLDQSIQDRVNTIEMDLAALDEIMGSWPVADWKCLLKK